MVTEISATSPSPNFHLGKSYVEKNNNVLLFRCGLVHEPIVLVMGQVVLKLVVLKFT